MSTALLLALTVFGLALLHGVTLDRWRQAIQEASSADQGTPVPEHPVKVSVLVAARNAEDTLTPLLQDLHAQHLPGGSFEVLVVDDHSTDGTAVIVQGMARTWPALRLLEAAPGQGKKAAIMRGEEEATGDLIVLTDADARCGPHRLQRIVSHWREHGSDLILMPVNTEGGKGVVGWLQRKEQAALQAATAGSGIAGSPMLANGANLAFSRAGFHMAGGFRGDRRSSGDDMFLLQRMRRHRRPVSYLLHPDVVVRVGPECTWGGFFAQRLRWAGKMWAYRDTAGLLGAMAAVLFPWMLTALTVWIWYTVQVGQGLFYTATLLAAAWMVWLVPISQLVSAMERFWVRASGGSRRPADTSLFNPLAVAAFAVYAPVVAILSIFVRPRWKGRRIRS